MTMTMIMMITILTMITHAIMNDIKLEIFHTYKSYIYIHIYYRLGDGMLLDGRTFVAISNWSGPACPG